MIDAHGHALHATVSPAAGRTRIAVSILVSHPIQYFVPVYRALAGIEDVDLRVVYRTRTGLDGYADAGFGRTVRWDVPLLDGYRSTFLSGKTTDHGFEPAIVGELARHRPDVLVLHGYGRPTNLVALAAARLLGVRVLMRGDTRASARHVGSAKRAIKRGLFGLLDGCIAIGAANRDYYRSLGVPEARIFFAPMAVDNDAFALRARDPVARRVARSELGIEEAATVVLFAGKLTRQKRVDDLLLAFLRVRAESGAILAIVGSGPEEGALRKLADGAEGRVRFLGFRNQSELPQLYAAADLFVLPSSDEAWGLVLNEAMAAGLPVVASDGVGAAPDLVTNKDTGCVYPCGDIDRLAEALDRLIGAPYERERMGRNAARLIERWSVQASARGIAEAVRSVSGDRWRA